MTRNLFSDSDFWRRVDAIVRRASADSMGQRMLVHSISGDMVGLKNIRGEYEGLAPYVGPWKLAVDDEVWVEPVSRFHKDANAKYRLWMVIGPVIRDGSAPASLSTGIPLIIAATANELFKVRNAGGTDFFNVNTTAGFVDLPNDAVLRLYADAYSTVTAEIDGADGSASFGAVTAKSVNTPVVAVQSQTSPTPDSSTTSTTVFSTAMTMSMTLPAGTWTVYALGWLGVRHSASGAVRFAVSVDDTEGTARTPDGPSSGFRTIEDDATIAGVSGGRSIDIDLLFRSQDTGTTTVNNPAAIAIAKRTA